MGCGENQLQGQISIHTSREGCDTLCTWSPAQLVVFQSTHPVRDVTLTAIASEFGVDRISIHTSREGCDNQWPV